MLNDRRVQFAVGVTVVVLLIRWLVTGDILFVSSEVMAPQSDNPRALITTLTPLLVEALVWIGASVIAWLTGIWQLLAEKIGITGVKVPSIEAQTAFDREVVLELAKAAALGERQRVDELIKELRTPHVIAEQVRHTLLAGQYDRAHQLIDELKRLAAGEA